MGGSRNTDPPRGDTTETGIGSVGSWIGPQRRAPSRLRQYLAETVVAGTGPAQIAGMRYVWFLVLPGLVACAEDAVDPPVYECPPPCIAATFDVAVDTVLVTGPSVVAPDGRPAFPPDQVSIEYLLRNPGDTTTTPVSVSIGYLGTTTSDDVAPIAPGDTVRRTIRLEIGELEQFRTSDADEAFLSAHAPGRTGLAQSYGSSPRFHIMIPMLRTRNYVDSLTVRAGRSLPGHFEIENTSPWATSRPFRMKACLLTRFDLCSPQDRPLFGDWRIPALAPGETFRFADSIVVPPASAWQDEDLTYRTYLVVVPDGYDDPYVDAWYGGVRWVDLHVLPDYAYCSPPLLIPGDSLALPAYNCGLRPPTTLTRTGPDDVTLLHRFHLVMLPVQAGRTYAFEWSGALVPPRFYDADGLTQLDLDTDPVRIRFAATRTVYAVLYSTEDSVTVSLAALQ